MARRAFFSFHYERDIWRANVVRNSWVTQDRQAAGFFDASMWESAKTRGDAAMEQLIKDGLGNTSVTAVLIGPETASRQWVRYEIQESFSRGNGMLGIYIHNIPNSSGLRDSPGSNPFATISRTRDGVSLASLYPTYDWVREDGYANLGSWIERAATAAGR